MIKRLVYIFLFISSFSFGVNTAFAGTPLADICPGEPVTLNWSSSSVTGSCTPSWSAPSCQFSVVPNTTNSTPINTDVSCSVTLTCDGITDSSSVGINPNQSRCCGSWSLSSQTVWNGTQCVAPAPSPTGSFTSAPSCTIAAGASSCTSTISWSITNPVSPDVRQNGTNFSSLASGSVSRTLIHGTNTFELYDGASLLDTKNPTADCIAGTTWDTGVCRTTPTIGTFTNDGPVVSGSSANLSWTGVTNATSCSIDNGIGAVTTADSSIATGALTTTTTFNLTCVNGGLSNSKQTAVTVTPVSGAITAADCTVAVGSATCTTPTSWTTNTPTWRFTSCKIDGSAQCVPAVPPASPDYIYVNPDLGPHNLTMTGDPAYRRIFNLWKDLSWTTPFVDQQIHRGNCASGSYWNGSICTFGTHTLTVTAPAYNSISVNYACDPSNPNVQSATISRSPSPSPSVSATSGSFNDISGVTENTTYTYTLTCWSGPSGTGINLGGATKPVTTPYQAPAISTGGTCSNGASDFPTCGTCAAGTIFDGLRCKTLGSGTMCGGTITNPSSGQTGIGLPGTCGNNIVEVGEECDGNGTLQALQKCSSSCKIYCQDGSKAPGCGLTASQYCTNGAIQNSAPSGCNVCPTGQYLSGGRCVTPVCGNGIKEGSESCDGSAGIVNPAINKCTAGCCIALTPPTSCFPTFTITCSNGGSLQYGVLNRDTGTSAFATSTYAPGPRNWTPTTSGNYRLMCINGTQVASADVSASGSCSATGSPTSISLFATPKTIQKGGNASLSWKTIQPNGACKIIARPTITTVSTQCNASCVSSRQEEADRITNLFAHGTTDASDPNGAGRTMITALGVVGDATQSGKKSVELNYSMEFIGTCALNYTIDPKAVKVRVNVAGDIEG